MLTLYIHSLLCTKYRFVQLVILYKVEKIYIFSIFMYWLALYIQSLLCSKVRLVHNICKTLKKNTIIRKRQKITIPMRSEQQKGETKKRCGRLYRNFKNLSWIIDDESIFTLSNSSSNGNNKFYTSNITRRCKIQKKEV